MKCSLVVLSHENVAISRAIPSMQLDDFMILGDRVMNADKRVSIIVFEVASALTQDYHN